MHLQYIKFFRRKFSFILLLCVFTFLQNKNVYSQTHPGTSGTKCGGCTPAGWSMDNGSPDISDTTGWGFDNSTWTGVTNPPNGEKSWLSECCDEKASMDITGLTSGTTYSLQFYYMAAKSSSFLFGPSSHVGYSIDGGSTIVVDIPALATWYLETVTFVATGSTAKFSYFGGEGTGSSTTLSNISFAPNSVVVGVPTNTVTVPPPGCTKTFNTAGASTWTAPSCVNSVTVECWGAGGGSGGDGQDPGGGTAGGGGAYSSAVVPVTPGITYTLNVGAAGTAGTGPFGAAGSNGGNGGDSWFINNTTVMAKGGSGGKSRNGVSGILQGALGGSAAASVGTVKHNGGNGGSTNGNNPGSCCGYTSGGGGGSSAGPNSDGNNGGDAPVASKGPGGAGGVAVTGGGAGGAGTGNGGVGNAGAAGSAPGGGGGGGQDHAAGAAGGVGQIKLTCISSSASISVNNATICSGQSATLTASGSTDYSWSTGSSANSIVVSPTSTTSYTVSTTSGGCAVSAVAKVTINSGQTSQTTQTYSTAGTSTWTAPVGVTSVDVECWGGGGAGGGTTSAGGFNGIGGGGGGGAYTKSTVTVVPGTPYTIVVGAAALGTSGAAGPDGISSTFGTGGTLVTGAGGKGGAMDTGTGGAGGTGTHNGGNGGAGDPSSGSAGGGAGGAGSTGNGANGDIGSVGTGGTGGTGGGGKGGAGGPTDGSNGTAGIALGGGGGGADGGFGGAAQKGGDGGLGKVIITYTPVSSNATMTSASAVTICSGTAVGLAFAASVPSTFTWKASDNSNTTGESLTNQTTATLTDVIMNNGTSVETITYTVTPVPAGGCSTGTPQIVTVTLNVFDVTVNDASICSGQSATLTASGGTTYDWLPATGLSSTTGTSVTANPTTTTTYTVTGNSGGCTGKGYSTITLKSADDASFSYTPSTVCQTGGSDPTPVLAGTTGGTFSCNPSLTINPSSGVIDLASASVGSYTVTYTTAGACADSKTFVISIVNATDATFSYAGPSYCQNDPNPSPIFTSGSPGTFSSSPGLSFLNTAPGDINLSPGEIDLSASTPGMYTVTNTIPASGSCLAATATNTITINPTPVTTVDNQVTCAGTAATLTAGGATTYKWSDNSTPNTFTASPANTTSYTVTGSTLGCSSSAIGTIAVNASPVITITSTNAATICDGGSLAIKAHGATTYSWSTGAATDTTTVKPTVTTTYTVTGTSSNCSSKATILVTVNPLPTITVNSPNICKGQSATLTASGGGSYVWSDTTFVQPKIISPASSTSYTVYGSTANCSGMPTTTPSEINAFFTCWVGGCINLATATVTVNQLPVIKVNSVAICAGQSATLNASGGSTYNWSTGASTNTITVSPVSTTSYTVADNTAGCSGAAVGTVTVNLPPVVSVNSSTICSGQSATLTAAGATSYLWTPGNSASNPLIVSPGSTTPYTVTGNPGGCSGSAIGIVTVNPSPVLTVNASSLICVGQSTTLTVGGANTYSWLPTTYLNPTTGTTVTADPTSTITYSVTGISSNGCSAKATSMVIVSPGPIADPGADTTIVFPSSAQLLAMGGGAYNWTPSTGLSCTACPNPIASPTVTTNYCVKVTDAANCIDSACVKITVETPCITNTNLEVPNAFSPNNDGRNDALVLHGWERCVTQFSFSIFDRWGEKVFESKDPLIAWDGTFRGQPLGQAVFVYFIDATLSTGEKINKKGNISLIR